jgi:site-specific DNA-methyltransferase (adenine-specific)/modification methylase
MSSKQTQSPRPTMPKPFLDTLIEADCLEAMQELPTGSVDMILCDLPYGTTRNGWDSLIPLKPLWDEYLRVVKERGAIVLTAQGLFTARLMTSCEEHFKYKIVWMKSKATNFLNAKRQPLRKHEDICVFYQKAPTYNPQMSEGDPYDKGVRKDQLTGSYGDFDPAHVKSEGQRYPTDVVYFKTAESEGEVWHPTQKPVALGRYLVRTFTNPGDVVLDNAFGSGSFLVASLLEGRHFIGIEKNDQLKRFKGNEIDCIDLARKRLEEAKERLARTGESPQDISVDASEETSYEPSGQTMSLFQDVEVREVNFDDDSWQ